MKSRIQVPFVCANVEFVWKSVNRAWASCMKAPKAKDVLEEGEAWKRCTWEQSLSLLCCKNILKSSVNVTHSSSAKPQCLWGKQGRFAAVNMATLLCSANGKFHLSPVTYQLHKTFWLTQRPCQLTQLCRSVTVNFKALFRVHQRFRGLPCQVIVLIAGLVAS